MCVENDAKIRTVAIRSNRFDQNDDTGWYLRRSFKQSNSIIAIIIRWSLNVIKREDSTCCDLVWAIGDGYEEEIQYDKLTEKVMTLSGKLLNYPGGIYYFFLYKL